MTAPEPLSVYMKPLAPSCEMINCIGNENGLRAKRLLYSDSTIPAISPEGGGLVSRAPGISWRSHLEDRGRGGENGGAK